MSFSGQFWSVGQIIKNELFQAQFSVRILQSIANEGHIMLKPCSEFSLHTLVAKFDNVDFKDQCNGCKKALSPRLG